MHGPVSEHASNIIVAFRKEKKKNQNPYRLVYLGISCSYEVVVSRITTNEEFGSFLQLNYRGNSHESISHHLDCIPWLLVAFFF